MTGVFESSSLFAGVAAEALLHFVWQGTALGAITALVVRRLRDHPQARYAVGVGALAAMAVAPLVTTLWLLSGATAGVVTGTVDAPLFAARGGLPVAWILGVWVTGVVACSVRLLGGWSVARRLAREATEPVSREIGAIAQALTVRLGVTRPVRVLQSRVVAVPMMVGWLTPVVLLPASVIAGLPVAHLEALIAHEIAHIRRHDYLVNLLQSVVETLLFYHPAVWWVSRDVREAREQCCDDLAVRVCDRLTYVSALSRIAALRVAAPAVAATGGSLLVRIERLLRPQPLLSSSLSWLAVLPVAVVLAAAMPVAVTPEQAAPIAGARVVSAAQPAPEAPPAAAESYELTAQSVTPQFPNPPSSILNPQSFRPALPVVLDFFTPTANAQALLTPPPPPPPQVAPAPEPRVSPLAVIRVDWLYLAAPDLDMSGWYTVGADGTITIKHAGALHVAGKTAKEIEKILYEAMVPKFYQDGVIDVGVRIDHPTRFVLVNGEVQNPGRFEWEPGMTVGKAVALAGGTTTAGRPEYIIRPEKDARGQVLRYTKVANIGPASPMLADDDLKVSRQELFYVVGEVQTPGQKIWEPGMTVVKAVALAGGLTAKGRLGYLMRPVKDADGKVIKHLKVKALKPETPILPGDELHIERKWFGGQP